MGISSWSISSAFSSTNSQIKFRSALENVIMALSADLLIAESTFCTLKSSLVPSFFTTFILLQSILSPFLSVFFCLYTIYCVSFIFYILYIFSRVCYRIMPVSVRQDPRFHYFLENNNYKRYNVRSKPSAIANGGAR